MYFEMINFHIVNNLTNDLRISLRILIVDTACPLHANLLYSLSTAVISFAYKTYVENSTIF